MTNLTFGQKLMILRRNKNLSQKKLAEQTHVGVVNIARYETEATLPNAQTLVQLSNFFNVSIDYLLKEHSSDINIADKELLDLAEKADRLIEEEKSKLKNIMRSYLGNN